MAQVRSNPVAITDPTDPVVRLLHSVESEREGLVAVADRLEHLLEEKDLLYMLTIAPRSVGVDPSNRDGEGINPLNVLSLAGEIADVGFSYTEIGGKPICCEVSPGDSSVEEFNVKLSTDSGMADVPKDSIHYGSLSCSHTNYVLRCVAAGVPSEDELLSEGGHMSVGKIGRRDKKFADAVATGLNWKVIRWQVRFQYPAAIQLIQQARNVAGTMTRLETEMQGLLRLHSAASLYQTQDLDIPWALIKKRVLRSRPPFAASINELAHFVMSRSGGTTGVFLKHLASFVRNHVKSDRTALPAPVYAAVANMQHQYVSLAVWQTAWMVPGEQVQAGVCRGITAGEINQLAKAVDTETVNLLRTAEEMMSYARADLIVAGIHEEPDSTKLSKSFARLDVSVARFLLGKPGKLASLRAAAEQFASDLRKDFPDAQLEVFEKRFQKAGHVEGQGHECKATGREREGPHPKAGMLTLVEQDSHGNVVDPLGLLRRHGFDLGSYAAAAGVETVYQIVGFERQATGHEPEATGPVVLLWAMGPRALVGTPKAHVHGAIVHERQELKVKLEDFLATWELKDLKTVVEQHPGWPANRPKSSDNFRSLARRGAVLQALSHLYSTAGLETENQVALFTKPVRKVEATSRAEVGVVVLLPEGIAVAAKPRGEVAQPGAVEVKFVPEDSIHKYYIMPCIGTESVAPLWLVGTTPDEERANMAWSSVSVQCILGHDFTGALKPAGCRPTSPAVAECQTALKGKAAVAKAKTAAKAKATAAKKGAKQASKSKASADTAGDLDSDESEAPPPVDLATSAQMIVPYLLNIKMLNTGDELLVFKAASSAAPKRARDVEPIRLSDLVKKQRA
jgi:hypothetical protein